MRVNRSGMIDVNRDSEHWSTLLSPEVLALLLIDWSHPRKHSIRDPRNLYSASIQATFCLGVPLSHVCFVSPTSLQIAPVFLYSMDDLQAETEIF